MAEAITSPRLGLRGSCNGAHELTNGGPRQSNNSVTAALTDYGGRARSAPQKTGIPSWFVMLIQPLPRLRIRAATQTEGVAGMWHEGKEEALSTVVSRSGFPKMSTLYYVSVLCVDRFLKNLYYPFCIFSIGFLAIISREKDRIWVVLSSRIFPSFLMLIRRLFRWNT